MKTRTHTKAARWLAALLTALVVCISSVPVALASEQPDLESVVPPVSEPAVQEPAETPENQVEVAGPETQASELQEVSEPEKTETGEASVPAEVSAPAASSAPDTDALASVDSLPAMAPANELLDGLEGLFQPATLNLNNITSFGALQTALAEIAADDGTGTITLAGDIVLENPLAIDGIQVTIDAGAHTLTAGAFQHFVVGASGSLALTGGVLDGDNAGGGIKVEADSSLTATGTRIENCTTGTTGTGAAVTGLGTVVLNSVIIKNCSTTATNSGAGIYAAGKTTLNNTSIQSCTGNTARGAGIYQSAAQAVELNDSLITGCTTGVFASNTDTILILNNSNIEYSTGRGVDLGVSGAITMTGTSSVSHNGDTGIYASSKGTIVLEGSSQVSHNKTSNGRGSGAGIRNMSGTITMSGSSQVSHNTEAGIGGGIYMEGTRLTMSDNAQISHNEALLAGGGVYATVSTSAGNGYILMNNSASFIGNKVLGYQSQDSNGGAIYLDAYGLPTGSLYLQMNGGLGGSGDTHRFENNSARDFGGAIYMTGFQDYSLDINLARSSFSGNIAGKGIYTSNDPGIKYYYYLKNNQGVLNGYHKWVMSVSLPDALADHFADQEIPVAFNNLDIFHEGSVAYAGNVTVEYYVDGAKLHSETLSLGDTATEPTLGDLGLTLGADEYLDGWYDDEGDEWNFDTPVYVNTSLYATVEQDVEDTHTVTVLYFDGVSGTHLGTKKAEDVVDGTPTADALIAEIGTGWLNAYKPNTGDYADGTLEDAMPPTVTQDVTVNVVYQLNTYTVTVNYYDGSTTGALLGTQKAEDVVSGTPTAGALVDEIGASWLNAHKPNTGDYADGVVDGALPPNVAANITVNVVYQLNTYTVTVNYYDGSTTGALLGTQKAEDVVSGTPTADALVAEIGAGWLNAHKPNAGDYADGVVDGTLPPNVTQNITVNVVYLQNQPADILITYHAGSGNGGTSVTLPSGGNHTVYTAAQAGVSYIGHGLIGWTSVPGGNAVEYTAGQSLQNLTASMDMYAIWQKRSYPLTWDAQGGSPAPAGGQAEYDSLLAQPATSPAKEGHSFIGWYRDAAATQAWRFDTDTMPAGPLTLYAGYDADYFRVVFYRLEGEIYWDDTVAFGSAINQPTAPNRLGHVFGGWLYNGQLWDFSTPMPAHTVELYALWTPEQTTSVVNPDPGPGPDSSSSSSSSRAPSSSRPASSTSVAPSSAAVSSAPVSSAPGSSEAPAPSAPAEVSSSPAPALPARGVDENGGRGEPGDDDYIQPGGILSMFGNELPMGGLASIGGWSVTNLLLALIALAGALITMARTWARAKRRGARPSAVRWLALAAGALPILLFLILERISGPMILISKWTPLITAVCVAELAVNIVATVLEARKRSQ